MMKNITFQEMKVLGLLGRGNSSEKIAASLGISIHTVISHRKSLMIKLGAKNAAELVYRAVQQNILDTSLTDHG
ncbi:MAG TPA: hypothetical protein DIS90_16060 [Cytophagales bacterium]|nr:hypothetical protein [Cytophagales bacterium]HCR53320.1 hypothetical protein [Cytophagales bacterium]